MPFTIAHPAAVLPLRRLSTYGVPWSAFVVGAIAPDLDYFLALRPHVGVGHTPLGTLTFCLPLGLLLLVGFHWVVKGPSTLLLPPQEAARLWPLATASFRPRGVEWLGIGVAVVVGAWSHLVWDAFTHAGRWGTETIPLLNTTLATIRDYDVTVFKLLQHGSTVFGMTALAIAYARWRGRTPPSPGTPTLPLRFRVLAIVSCISLSIVAALVHTRYTCGSVEIFRDLRACLGVFVVSSITFGAVCTFLCALLIRWRFGGARTGS